MRLGDILSALMEHILILYGLLLNIVPPVMSIIPQVLKKKNIPFPLRILLFKNQK
jgi:hypothetical protein